MHPRRNEGGPRRPRRDRTGGRGGREARSEPGMDRERSEQDFIDEMHPRLQQFLASDEQGMALEPMNSFKRRIVHNLSKEYGVETESRGEERDRHVYLIRTTSSATPSTAPRRPPQTEGQESPPAEREPPDAGDEPPSPRHEEPRARRDAPPARRERPADDATDFSGSARVWDFGSQTFPVNPGANGVHIAVKRDGSIELFQERDRNHVVAERVVTSKQFRVRKGKIVQPGEPGW